MRRFALFSLVFITVALAFAAFSSTQNAVGAQEENEREIITISISLFLLVDDRDDPDLAISTHRTEDDLREILDGMNDIWSQADIQLELPRQK